MAITIDHLSGDGTIKVIARIDSALEYDEEVYSSYLKSNDETVLTFREGSDGQPMTPTRFVIRKTIPYKTSQKIKANQVRLAKGDAYFNSNTTTEEVKYALVDIEQPHDVKGSPLTFGGVKVDDGKGGSMVIANDQTMAVITQLNIVDDLYTARRNFIEKGGDGLKKS